MEKTKKKFLKNMVGFSMVTWITFAISFIATPIATRLFPTEEYGKINVFLSYASIFGSACYLGLDQAFVRFFNEPPGQVSRKGLFTFCTVAPLTLSVIIALPAAFMWRGISEEVAGAPNLTVFICLGIFGFCQVLYRFLSLSYRMEQNALMYTVQGVTYVIVTKIAYLCVGFGSSRGVAAITLLTVLMGIYTLIFVLVQRSRFDVRALRRVDKPFIGTLAAFALPLVPLTVLSELSGNISKLALNELLGLSATAVYSSALGLASTINIIQTGFNTYWAPYVFENYKCDGERRFFTVHKLMACLLTLFGLSISLLQTPVFLLLGKSYRGSAIFFPFLFISPICYCLSETTDMGITIARRTYWTTLIFTFSTAVNVALCYLFIPIMGMAGAALAAAFSGILTMLFRTLVGNHYYKVLESYRYIIMTIGLMLVASFGNLYLTGAVKYAALAGVLALALVLFRAEVKTLWTTALQILAEGRGMLRRRKESGHE